MDLVGIIVTIVVAGIVFSVQEIRMKLALRKQRKDLRADFRQDLKNIIPALFETWWKERESKQTPPPEMKSVFAGIAETTATAWFDGKDIPLDAIFSGQDSQSGNLKEDKKKDNDNDDYILVK